MRKAFSLKLNINTKIRNEINKMKVRNALFFYQALHLRMPEDFASISNPHRGPKRLSKHDLG